MRNSRYLGLWLILVLVLSFGCGKKGEKKRALAFPDSIVDGEVIAVVNDYPIKGRELKLFALMFNQVNKGYFPDSTFNRLLLDKMIDRVLIYKEALAQGSVLDDSTRDSQLNRFIASMGGEKAMENFLRDRKFTREELMASLRKDIVINNFIQQRFAKEATVEEADAREYYEKNRKRFDLPDSVKARHILIKILPGDGEAEKARKRKTMESILARIKAGEDFAKLATQYSEDPSSVRGGDLGFFARHTMIAPFDSVAFSLKEGEVSDVVETPFGYHIIKVEGKRKGVTLKFEEVKNTLMANLWEYKMGSILQKHLQTIRQTAIIKRYY